MNTLLSWNNSLFESTLLNDSVEPIRNVLNRSPGVIRFTETNHPNKFVTKESYLPHMSNIYKE